MIRELLTKKIFIVFIFFLTALTGCSDNCNDSCYEKNLECDCCPKADTTNMGADSAKLSQINLFLETSGSMSGLMPQTEAQTEFQTIIPDILLRFRDEIKNTKLYSIYDSKSEFKLLDIDSTRINLIPNGKFSWSGSTYIPVMIDSILNNVGNESVNILISDCIYTPETKDLALTSQTISEIREKFNRVSKNYSTTIYCLKSDFYFSKNEKTKSPFYFIVIGKTKHLKLVSSLLNKSFKTFNIDFTELNFERTDTKPYYSILPYSFNSGNNIGISCPNYSNAYLVLREIDFAQSDKLEFTVGIDLSEFPGYAKSKNYLEKNFEIKIDGNDFNSFKIETKDELQSGIKSDDKNIFQNCSNYLKMEIKSLEKEINKVDVSLKFSIPEWVREINNDDLNSAESSRDKTYGLEKIIKGIEEAYNVSNNPYFFKNLQIVLIKK